MLMKVVIFNLRKSPTMASMFFHYFFLYGRHSFIIVSFCDVIIFGAPKTMSLHDAAELESFEFYSQFRVYKDKCQGFWGWPLKLSNPYPGDSTAWKLWEVIKKLVEE